MMQIHDRIDALTRRAASLNLSLWRVCKLAGVDYSIVSRWRKNECNPTIVKFSEVTTKVESQIEELELDMAMRLIERINPDAAPRIAEMLKASEASGAHGQVGQSEADAERASASEPEKKGRAA